MIQHFQITARHMCAGLTVKDGIVINAAPIIYYMVQDRWSLGQLQDYVKKKGWSLEELK